jgi:hypothetical protein
MPSRNFFKNPGRNFCPGTFSKIPATFGANRAQNMASFDELASEAVEELGDIFGELQITPSQMKAFLDEACSKKWKSDPVREFFVAKNKLFISLNFLPSCNTEVHCLEARVSSQDNDPNNTT